MDILIEHLKHYKSQKTEWSSTGTNIISQLQATVMATCWPVCILNHKPLGEKNKKKQRLNISTKDGACTNTTQNNY